jgi:hypothetical protein
VLSFIAFFPWPHATDLYLRAYRSEFTAIRLPNSRNDRGLGQI